MKLRAIIQTLLLFTFFSVLSCFHKQDNTVSVNDNSSYNHIKASGVLRAVTIVNSTGYYLFKGMPAGFHYDLLKKFAENLDVNLRVYVVNKLEDAYQMIAKNEADVLALDLTITNERQEFLSFSKPLFQSSQVLVYRQGTPNPFQVKSSFLNLSNTFNKIEVHVPAKSSFINTLESFADGKKKKINVIELNNKYQEDIIKMVADKQIDYTVSDQHIANLICKNIGKLNYSLQISQPMDIAWAVNPNSKMLLDKMNQWLTEFKSSALFRFLYKKYYQSPGKEEYTRKYLLSKQSKRISPYDEIIKKHANEIGWDWRLIASLIYQESQFRADLVSRKGAFGIMQMMPQTAAYFGIDTLSGIEQQIVAGIKYLKFLEKNFTDIKDSTERIKFILSSYNSGPGHTLDARRLAEKYDKNPDYWDKNVDSFVLRKAYPKYYRDPVVRHGYSRGYESFKLVYEVLERYYHYCNLIPYH